MQTFLLAWLWIKQVAQVRFRITYFVYDMRIIEEGLLSEVMFHYTSYFRCLIFVEMQKYLLELLLNTQVGQVKLCITYFLYDMWIIK